MDPTLIPALRKNQQDDGGDPVREVRRPRHDKGKVYLERIGTIGPGLLKEFKARELSLVNHKRQGPLQAFREKERIRKETTLTPPIRARDQSLYSEKIVFIYHIYRFLDCEAHYELQRTILLKVKLLEENLVCLIYEAYGGKSVISGSTGPLVLVRWAEHNRYGCGGQGVALGKTLGRNTNDGIGGGLASGDSLGTEGQLVLSHGQTVLSEVQAKWILSWALRRIDANMLPRWGRPRVSCFTLPGK